MRRQRLGACGLAGLLLVAVGAVAGCGGGPLSPSAIDGMRTDPDHQGLVVSYLGGECDGSAHLRVTETATRVDANVVVRGGGGSCSAVGIIRTVSARLDQPIGTRTVWSAGRQQVPFDGARLLAPLPVPADFTDLREMGAPDAGSDDLETAKVTTTWVTRRFDSSGTTTDGSCRPTRGTLEVRLGPASAPLARGLDKVGNAKVRGVEAQVFRGGSAKKPTFWAYGWTTGTSSVVVSSGPQCPGDQILTRTELLRVAESLRPA